MAATNKVRRTILLTPVQAKALKRLSKETEIPQQVLMRRGIDLVLAEHAETTTHAARTRKKTRQKG